MADTTGNTEATPAAGGAEIQIPKYRLDELAEALRRAKEEIALKDRLYLEDRQRMQPQARVQQELTPEDTGLDPTTHAAIIKVANMIADRKINERSGMIEQQIGILSGRTEKAELLAKKGSDKSKYLSDIEEMQKAHFRNTGGFMPAETCLEILQGREKDRRIAELEAQMAGKAQAQTTTPQTTQTQSVPNAAATRSIPSGGVSGGATTNKTFAELSVEEMESRLQEQFGAGNLL